MMLSSHAIFEDSVENKVSSKNLKTNFGPKLGSTGLKNKTNIVHDRCVSDSVYEGKKSHLGTFKKNLNESGKKYGAKPKKSNRGKTSEKWPEVENMHIYVEPEDDYEDILPKHERIQKHEIDCFFTNSRLGRLVELTCEQKPPLDLEPVEDCYSDLLSSSFPYLSEDLLFDSTPLADIPPIDLLF